MRSHPCNVIAIAVAAAAACASPGPEPGRAVARVERAGAPAPSAPLFPECPIEGSTCVEVGPGVTIAEACPGDRWIGYLADSDGSCRFPRPGLGWQGARLFEPVGTGPTWGLAPGLARFCEYTWAGAEPPGPAAIGALHTHLDGVVESLARDCMTVVPAASEIVEQSWQQLHEHVQAQVGFLPSLPQDLALPPRTVRVAVIDSIPSDYDPGSGNTGESPHGWAVGRLIRELSCPAPLDPASACVSVVSPHLALPLDATGAVDLQGGGSYGRVSDLAKAVVEAVNEWRLHNHDHAPSSPDYQARLLVNLSVAWQTPEITLPAPGPGGSALPAPARAVYAALAHLDCWGGTAIAAAGNDPGGPEPVSGAMAPATWETEPAPDPLACAQLEGAGYDSGLPYPLFPPAGTYAPLLYAAGAVRADNRPIASTRAAGRPRLAALGAHVVAADRDSGVEVPTAVQTGSSMAAAVVSGSAAAAWAYAPELPGAVLMARVFGAGTDLGQSADFCLGGQPCPYPSFHPARRIRRVWLCNSIEEVCDLGGSRCPSTPLECAPLPPATLPVPTPGMVELVTLAAKAEGGVRSAIRYDESLPPLAVCGHDGFQTDGRRYADSTCPFRQWGQQRAPRPQVGPQPGGNPCPACWMSLSAAAKGYQAEVYVSIDPEYPYAVTGGTVDVPGYGEIELGELGTLEPGEEAKLTGIAIDAPGPFDTATINFRDADMMIDGSYVAVDSASASELIVWTE